MCRPSLHPCLLHTRSVRGSSSFYNLFSPPSHPSSNHFLQGHFDGMPISDVSTWTHFVNPQSFEVIIMKGRARFSDNELRCGIGVQGSGFSWIVPRRLRELPHVREGTPNLRNRMNGGGPVDPLGHPFAHICRLVLLNSVWVANVSRLSGPTGTRRRCSWRSTMNRWTYPRFLFLVPTPSKPSWYRRSHPMKTFCESPTSVH